MSPRRMIDVDTSEFERFARRAPVEAQKAAVKWYRRGGQIVRAKQVEEGKQRFGVETSQSRMQTVDPSRPKGRYTAGIEIDVTQSEGRVGTDVPYRWWVEEGSEAPSGKIPPTHTESQFIGHKPVKRGTEAAQDPAIDLLNSILEDAMSNATGGI